MNEAKYIGRFGDEPIDKVMLFVATAMATGPKLAQYRFELLAALWCRYRSASVTPTHPVSRDKSVKQDDLVDWFTFALFGRHARVLEVRTWLKRSSEWLPEEPEREPEDHHIEYVERGEEPVGDWKARKKK